MLDMRVCYLNAHLKKRGSLQAINQPVGRDHRNCPKEGGQAPPIEAREPDFDRQPRMYALNVFWPDLSLDDQRIVPRDQFQNGIPGRYHSAHGMDRKIDHSTVNGCSNLQTAKLVSYGIESLQEVQALSLYLLNVRVHGTPENLCERARFRG